MPAKHDISYMREVAQLRGGKCLGKEYINDTSPLKWICEKGHTWDADYGVIRQGGWCMQCARGERAKISFDELKKIVAARGGKCLSDNYSSAKMRFQCAQGHIWETKSYVIKQGHWCPPCSHSTGGAKLKSSISEFIDIAQSRGGKLLSKKYISIFTPLKWECDKRHRWMAHPHNIKNGTWCPYCSARVKLDIAEMKRLAKAKGGICLSTEYLDLRSKLKWQCSKGHTWLATGGHVKHSNSWCPYCAGKIAHTIAEMKKLAKSNGGKCLSSAYINNSTHLMWQCAHNHVWKSVPKLILSGSWCPVCYKTRGKK